MNQQSLRIVGNLLDQAVATVGDPVFLRLTAELSDGDKANRIAEATRQVDLLRNGGMPAYDDELVDLFYVVQYQLSHVNLAYSMIRDAMSWRNLHNRGFITNASNLHVIDYGCGALAMRFGLILAVADAIGQGEAIREVRIDSLDPNVPLVQNGVAIWNSFVSLVQNNHSPHLNLLKAALATMPALFPDVYMGVPLKEIQRNPETDVWLSALHVIYEGPTGNEDDVRKNMAYLAKSLKPDTGFLTFHYGKRNAALRASPFEDAYQKAERNPASLFSNDIQPDRTTARLHWWNFRPSNWRVYWEWAPGTVVRTYQRL